ncbi:MAG: hypothetical protein JW976_15815 [Syntrophaceae bacterium]|nr:hypothetical protein [Syntrophaceae bacterium]
MKKLLVCVVVLVVIAFAIFYYFKYMRPAATPSAAGTSIVEQTVKPKVSWIPSTGYPYMVLKNVKFRFQEDIYVNIHNMVSTTETIKPYKYVDMNNVNSFAIKVISGQVSIDPSVMDAIFSKLIFNYDGAPLKEVKMSTTEMEVDGKKVGMLKVKGWMKLDASLPFELMGMREINGLKKLAAWFPFEMTSRVGLDKSTNRLAIEAEKVKSLGFPFVKGLMDLSRVKLEQVLPIKPGIGLSIVKNTMYVDTLGIMPPPKQIANVLDVQINTKNNCIDVKVGEEKPARVNYSLLVPDAKNYIYMFNGMVIFGKMLAADGKTQMIDNNPSDFFDFYLNRYIFQLSKSVIKMTEDASQIVYMPDYQSVVSK